MPEYDPQRLANIDFRFKDHRGKWCSVTLTLSVPMSVEELRANKSFLAANVFDGAMRNFDRICTEREEDVAKET